MKKLKKNWLRHLIQWGALLAIIIFMTKIFGNENPDCEAYCPFGGLQTIGSFLVNNSLACSMTATQIMMGVVLAIGVILFSKLFCGYLCPLGWATEYIGKLRKKLKIKEITINYGSVADKVLRLFKYVLLFWIFYMTVSSSELFCKNFDPYYATATGFKGELTLWMSLIAFGVFIIGNLFVKMFWCKYICPLGAISNIFKYAITFVVLVGIFALINFAGLSVSWVYLLGAASIIGYLWEVFYLEAKVFPLLKVVRSEEKCTDCGVCAKRCPYGINVDEVNSVKNVDCNLCGECISSCNFDALTFGGKKSFRWLPAILTVVLFAVGLSLGGLIEVPTINEKWGDEANYDKLEKITVEGLRSVHCYGSSKTFSATLQKIPGVYGVATYVKKSTADIYYLPSETTEDQIREKLYVPTKYKIANPPAEVENVKVITIFTEKMYDKLDPNYLGIQFKQTGKPYYGLETEYSCPLTVRIYMHPDEPIDEKFIKSVVQQKELVLPVAGGGTNTIKTGYVYEGIDKNSETIISKREFLERQFNKFSAQFKKNQENWDGKGAAIYDIAYPGLDKPIISRYLTYLSNHLSQQEGITAIETYLNDDNVPSFRFTFRKDILDENKLWEILTAPKWSIKYKDGSVKEMDASIPFKEKGIVQEVPAE